MSGFPYPRPWVFASVKRLALCVVFSALSVCGASAQSTSSGPKDGHTPSGIAPGNPTGSYALSGFESINPYNGKLNFSLPLKQVGGRGVGFAMHLPINQSWTYRRSVYDDTPNGGVMWEFWDTLFNDNDTTPYLSPGALFGRQPGEAPYLCGVGQDFYVYGETVTRLTFVAADGTEYELRDQVYGGKSMHHPYACTTLQNRGVTRGTVFATADGSSATFVSDDEIFDNHAMDGDLIFPSGVLTLKDGTRYRIEGGEVTSIRDRNGNRVWHDGTGWRDALGRTTTVQGGASTVHTIGYSGYQGTPQAITVTWGPLSQSLRPASAEHPAETLKTLGQLFPPPVNNSGAVHDPVRPKSVTLPTGRGYRFYYNSYGELARVELPTGGAIEYDWANTLIQPQGTTDPSGRRVAERRVYANGTTLESRLVYLLPQLQVVSTPHGNESRTVSTVVQYGAGGVKLFSEKHYYHGYAPYSVQRGQYYPLGHTPWREGKEYQTEVYDENDNLLRTTTQTWAQRAPVSWWTGNPNEEPSSDPRVVETTATLAETGQTSRRTFAYDQLNNQTDVWEYDYGKAYPSRHTHTDYLGINPVNGVDYAANGVHVRDLPAAQQVYTVNPDTGAEVLAAKTETKYDETTLSPWYGAVQGWADPGASRGNATKVRRWLDTAGVWVEARAEYDQCGSVTKSWDANNKLSQTAYSATYHYAYPTQMTSPIPDPSGQYGSTSAFVTTAAYDLSTGLTTSVTDANNQTTTYSYSDEQGTPDPLNRLRKVVRPGGLAAGGGGQTLYEYGDTPGNLYVRARTWIDAARTTDSFQYFDRLGRPFRSIAYENFDPAKPWVTGDTEYDALGRVKRTSMPYRAAAGAALFSTDKWAETTYDALGRVKTVTTKPDNAAVTTTYRGNQATVTDQAGKKRRSVTDALGRLVRLDEPNPAGSLDVNGAPAQPTSYTYDALGNLRRVAQGAQQRFFMYDTLGRLVRVRQPEQDHYAPDAGFPALSDPLTGNGQWSLAFAYDPNGNLTGRKDARGVVTSYAYDALNRTTTADYSDTAVNPDVTRAYDSAANGKGRLRFSYAGGNYSAGTTVEHTAFDSYDASGRPLVMHQYFKTAGVWAGPFEVRRDYDLAGNVTSQTYPSGRTVSYQYDLLGRPGDHAGQPAFKGTLGDGVARTYASELRYHELGGVEQERFGTDTAVYNKGLYNSRGQLSEIRVSTHPINAPGQETNWNRGAIINHYSQAVWGGSDQHNNGNLRTQQVWIPSDDSLSGWSLFEQTYAYDELNRLKRVSEGGRWQQEYAYDRWGNRTINADNSWGGVPEPQFTVDPDTNRLGVPAGYAGALGYDPAGNLTTDTYTGSGTRAYDAENRMTSAQDFYGQTTGYTYDADGRRVRRRVAGGTEVWQVYGMGGELLAEYAAHAAPESPRKEYGYRGGELLVTADAPGRTNVALSSAGATATAQGHTQDGVFAGLHFQPVYVNDGVRYATPQGDHYWRDEHGLPTWVRVDFGGEKTIDEVSVYTLPDHPSYTTQADPTAAQTFTQYGVTSFAVQYWTGSAWAAVPGGSVTGNNLVWRKLTFPAVTTSKIRVVLSAAADGVARVTEVEAWGASATSDVRWLVSDQLGTPRMVLDKTGSLAGVRRHDYLPFGEELPADAWRTAACGYAGDGVRQKFTGYERDAETGLDYARARYHAGAQGRFTGVDPLLASGSAGDPRTWNRYAYALNNPLKYVDPTGLNAQYSGTAEDQQRERARQQQQTSIPPPPSVDFVMQFLGPEVPSTKDPNVAFQEVREVPFTKTQQKVVTEFVEQAWPVIWQATVNAAARSRNPTSEVTSQETETSASGTAGVSTDALSGTLSHGSKEVQSNVPQAAARIDADAALLSAAARARVRLENTRMINPLNRRSYALTRENAEDVVRMTDKYLRRYASNLVESARKTTGPLP